MNPNEEVGSNGGAIDSGGLGLITLQQNTGTGVNSPLPGSVPIKGENKSDNFTATTENITPASSPPVTDVQAQLAEARQHILKLQKQLAEAQEGGVRRKNVAENPEKSGGITQGGITPVAMTATQEGVPVKIVAALCLVSFLLALLF